MSAGTGSGVDSTYNVCGIANGHAYSILSAFTMTDASGTANKVYMIRNPWGLDNGYNKTWKATDTKWTDALVAQVPLGIDPRKVQSPDGVFVVQSSDFNKCFEGYFIGHIRDSEGYVRTWYDNDKDDGTQKTFTFSPGSVNDTVYISVENYGLGVVPEKCLSNGYGALVTLKVVHKSLSY